MGISESTNLYLIVALAIMVAIVADLWLMKILANKFNAKDKGNHEAVFVFGRYSPVLSWLKKIFVGIHTKQSPAWIKNSTPEVEKRTSDSEQDQRSDNSDSNGVNKAIFPKISLMIIVIGVLIFCRNLFSFDSNLQLPGSESEVYQSLGLFFRQSLLIDGEFPLWNSYLRAGEPFIADPMLHIYNPIVAIPILLLDIQIGYRVALVLSYLMAAVGMWLLGRALGFKEVVNVWLGLMYAFAGQPTAHFFVGQYLFIFGFAWLPWVFRNLILYHRKRELKYVAYAACSVALVHFSGNAYYSFYLGLIIPLFAIIMCLRIASKGSIIGLDWGELRGYLLIGILSLSLAALHLLPLLEFHSRMGIVQEVLGSQHIGQIWLDYTSRDTFRADAYNSFPAREEYYAYIGFTPFIALLFLPLAWWKRERRLISFFVMLLMWVVLWIGLDQMPWRDLYHQTAVLLQFGNLLRTLIFGEIAILLLAAYGLDTVFGMVLYLNWRQSVDSDWRKTSRTSILILWGALMLWGIFDLLRTNSAYITLLEDDRRSYTIANWLRKMDTSEYFVRYHPVTSGHLALLSARLRNIDAWYHWIDVRFIEEELNRRPVEAKPHYILQDIGENPPQDIQVELLGSFNGYEIYRSIDSLPIAFSVGEEFLLSESDEQLKKSEVLPLTPLYNGNNHIEIIAEGDSTRYLVVLVRNLPGWIVRVDGRRSKLENVGGYLATRMEVGIHKYHFAYRPSSFYIGVWFTLVALMVCAYLIRGDLVLLYSYITRTAQGIHRNWREWINRTRKSNPSHRGVTLAVYRDGGYFPIISEEPIGSERMVLFPLRISAQISEVKLAWLVWRRASLYLMQTILQAISYLGILFFQCRL